MDIQTTNRKSLLTLKNVREVAMLAFFGVLTFKVANMDLTLNIEEFGFTDLLSIIVALFSIALSAAFYFKATETSNRFYDNSYTFTKDISEILGRMEAGFGERLRNLDEGYTGIRNRFENLPFDSVKVQADIEQGNIEIQQKEEEKRETLEELAKRAKLAEDEKTALFEKLDTLNRELEITRLKNRSLEIELDSNQSPSEQDLLIARVYLLMVELAGADNIPNGILGLNLFFNRIRKRFPSTLLQEMMNAGLLGKNGDITSNGLSALQRFIKSSK
jgi:hypothetical protein